MHALVLKQNHATLVYYYALLEATQIWQIEGMYF